MGTRHLIAIYAGGTHKVAQYGQWDGYPDGQGVRVLNFLHSLDKTVSARAFAENVRRCRFLTDNEISKINEEDDPLSMRPQLSRNLGAGILPLIGSGPDGGIVLQDMITFAGDSLFCEWAYVIDLDQEVFEVYRGFNKGAAVGRFKEFPVDEESGYGPVTRVASYPLNQLPEREQFLAEMRQLEDAEEEVA